MSGNHKTESELDRVLREIRLSRQALEIRIDQLRDDFDRHANAGFTFKREKDGDFSGDHDKSRAERVIAASDRLYDETSNMSEQIMAMWQIVRRCENMVLTLQKRVEKLERPDSSEPSGFAE